MAATKKNRKPTVVKKTKMYALRDTETNNWSIGKYFNTSYGWRANRPKLWKRLCDLSGAINRSSGPIKTTWEVVEYELVEVNDASFSVASIIKNKSKLIY